MATVIELGMAKEFNREQVEQLLPIVVRITKNYKQDVETLLDRLEIISSTQEDRIFEIEQKIDCLIDSWKQKIKKLGAKPKGLWSIDFDSGRGYFCWKYPQDRLLKHHMYSEACSKGNLLTDETKTSFLEVLSDRD